MKLNIVIGSTRPVRVSPTIGQWVQQAALEHARFDVEVTDLAAVNLPLLDETAHPRLREYEHEHTKRWSAIVDAADAFVFITPEYDYFPSAALVNAIQYLALEWNRKPAGMVSYGGISGGLRAAQILRQLLVNLNVHPLPQVVPIPNFPQFIGSDQVFRPNAPMSQGMTAMLDELWLWAQALHGMRSEARKKN